MRCSPRFNASGSWTWSRAANAQSATLTITASGQCVNLNVTGLSDLYLTKTLSFTLTLNADGTWSIPTGNANGTSFTAQSITGSSYVPASYEIELGTGSTGTGSGKFAGNWKFTGFYLVGDPEQGTSYTLGELRDNVAEQRAVPVAISGDAADGFGNFTFEFPFGGAALSPFTVTLTDGTPEDNPTVKVWVGSTYTATKGFDTFIKLTRVDDETYLIQYGAHPATGAIRGVQGILHKAAFSTTVKPWLGNFNEVHSLFTAFSGTFTKDGAFVPTEVIDYAHLAGIPTPALGFVDGMAFMNNLAINTTFTHDASAVSTKSRAGWRQIVFQFENGALGHVSAYLSFSTEALDYDTLLCGWATVAQPAGDNHNPSTTDSGSGTGTGGGSGTGEATNAGKGGQVAPATYNVLASKGQKLTPSTNPALVPKGAKNVKYTWTDAAGNIVGTAKTYTAKADGEYSVHVTYSLKNSSGVLEDFYDDQKLGTVKTYVPFVIDSKTGFDAIEWLKADGTTGSEASFADRVAFKTLQVVQGERLKLQVKINVKNSQAAPTGPFKYTWYKNGKAIDASPYNIASTEDTTATFITDAFTGAKADSYHVVVETVARAQKNGVNTEKPLVSVKSKALKPKIIVPPGEITVKTAAAKLVAATGKSVTIAVKATGTAKLTYVWTNVATGEVLQKNGKPINAASITLKPADPTGNVAGTYKVTVTNAAGNSYKQEKEITITNADAGTTGTGGTGEEHIH